MAEWHRVASPADIDEDDPVGIEVGTRTIAVFKVGDTFYATDGICPHAFAELSQGFVDGEEVECPLHQARFHIPTGKVMSAPATEDLRTYPVKVDGEDIYVAVEDG